MTYCRLIVANTQQVFISLLTSAYVGRRRNQHAGLASNDVRRPFVPSILRSLTRRAPLLSGNLCGCSELSLFILQAGACALVIPVP